MADNLIRPSGWHLWANCPGSLAMRPAEEPPVGDAAHEGTVAHYIAAQALKGFNERPQNFIGTEILVAKLGDETAAIPTVKFNGVGEVLYRCTVTPYMAECVEKYIEYISSFQNGLSISYVEQSLPLKWLAGEDGAEGTPDSVVFDGRHLHVFDLKYGREKIKAEGNLQLVCYAMSAFKTYVKASIDMPVSMHICQPQINHFEEWTISIEELIKWSGSARVHATTALAILKEPTETDSPEEYLNAGEHCQKGYCPARPYCPTLRDYMTELCDFDTLPLSYDELKKRYDSEAIADVYDKLKLIKGWANQVEEFVISEMEKGESFPGLKLVRGCGGNRSWDDVEAVEALMKQKRIKADVAFPRSLISPAKAEAAHKTGLISKKHWSEIEEHITKSAGKLTAVPLDDKRPAVNADGSDFEPLDTPEVKTDEVEAKVAKTEDDDFNFLD